MIFASLRSLRSLGAVFRTALLAVLDALGVEDAAQNVVAHARQVLDAAAADHDHRVLLQIVALTRNITNYLEAVGQTNLGDLAQRRVRFLRGRGVDARAYPALLRGLLQRRHLLARLLYHAWTCDQLVDRRHIRLHPSSSRETEKVSQIRSGLNSPCFPSLARIIRAKRKCANRPSLSSKRVDATEDRGRDQSARADQSVTEVMHPINLEGLAHE